MAVASMTGFARAQGSDDVWTWNWEAKSVNGRGLDIRCRLPQGAEDLEPEVRNRAAQRFKRGNFSITLTLSSAAGASRYQINRILLHDLAEAARELQSELAGLAPPSLDGLLAVRGVVEAVENGREGLHEGAEREHLLAALDELLDDLAGVREEEGARIVAALGQQLEAMVQLRDSAAGAAASRPEAFKQRFTAQLAELLEGGPSLPEERIAQEVALMATKLDVREELDRLTAHLDAARGLIASGGAIGRKLDFLCQEINREANTLCAKSADVELSRIGLEMKTTLDQFREQVQNIE